MSEDLGLRARRSDLWIWALVVLAVGSVVTVAILQGRRAQAPAKGPAPSLALPLLGGGTKGFPGGKITVVDFWATWCVPCRVSMPRLQRIWSDYRPRGVELYSVDTDDPAPDRDARVQGFLKDNRLTFPVALDDGSAQAAFSVAGLPTLVLVDRTGEVVFRQIGTLTEAHEQELRAALDRALR